MNPSCRVQDQLNTSQPTAPYIIGRELNLRNLAGRQWQSNPQPFEQLRPMTINTSASTETVTTAYTTFFFHRHVAVVCSADVHVGRAATIANNLFFCYHLQIKHIGLCVIDMELFFFITG